MLRDPVRVYRVPEPLPRAYVVGTARIASDREALTRLVDRSFDPTQEVVIASGPAAVAGPGFAGSCRILQLAADRIRLEAELSAPGYLILVDSYDPGWRAWIDGRPEPVLRANVAFRAVRVPAGRHTVEYRYQPTTVLVGAALSLLASLTGLVVAAWSTPRQARPEPASIG
jgi:hypothetical protein